MAEPKKQSLFAQRMQNARRIESNRKSMQADRNTTKFVDPRCFGEGSHVVYGPDAQSIHEENLKLLSAMTPEEIEEERKKLLAQMNPSVVDYLRNRKLANKSLNKNIQHSQEYQTSSADGSSGISRGETDSGGGGGLDTPEDVVRQTPAAELVRRFPHMDVVEPEKLKWMEDAPPPQPPPPGSPYNARFNFDGDLLPFYVEAPTEGLHHHGDEPARPGYTLQELMQLSRSSVLQQRVTAVSTLANIFLKASDYDACLDKPLLSHLLDSELFLLLRFTLDDPVRSVVSAAVAALGNLLVSVRDEGCLDRMLGLAGGLQQPTFEVCLDMKPNEVAELKDTELLKVDVIRGALRTNLLPRFRFILEELSPEPAEIGHIMRCLVRIARYSYESARAVANTPGLLKCVRKFLGDGPPRACSDGLKLFRVMACQGGNLAVSLWEKYNIIEVIQHFIAGNQDETSMSLVLESFYTWITFLMYSDIAESRISPFTPVIQRLLVTHADYTSLDSSGGDLEHAAAAVAWVDTAVRVDAPAAQCLLPPLRLCALKWLSQAPQFSSLKWPACKLLEAVLNAVATIADMFQEFNNGDIQRKVQHYLSSENFGHMSQNLRRHSWLLRRKEVPSVISSLPGLGVVPPTLYDTSPLPVVRGLARYLTAADTSELLERFVSSEGLLNYVSEVSVTRGDSEVTKHWFSRMEVDFLYFLQRIHIIRLNRNMLSNPTENSLVHQTALFLSTCIKADERYMLWDTFKQVLFNRHFFGSDITDVTSRLQSLHINSEVLHGSEKRHKLLYEALDSLETIRDCHLRHMGLAGLETKPPPRVARDSSLTTSYSMRPAVASDWVFTLISKIDIGPHRKDEDAVSLITVGLQWYLILERLRPSFLAFIPPATRFCALSTVLRLGYNIFQEVRDWLQESLNALLVSDRLMNFNNLTLDIKSFYDFYRDMLDHFVAESYCDPVYGQFVLIPLQQRHDIQLKKLVWCEMGVTLRFLSTPVDQIGVPLENFLEPCETDADLLQIYLSCLGQVRVRETFCPVLYRVAVHHVATFISLHPDQPVAKRLRHLIAQLGNQELKSLLQNYCLNKETSMDQ